MTELTDFEAEILRQSEEYVRARMTDQAGHAWDHVQRVIELAAAFAAELGADVFRAKLIAIWHDFGDWKFARNGSPAEARKWLENTSVDPGIIDQVEFFMLHHSFKGGTNPVQMETLEQQCVLDADCCDRLGVLGILRSHEFGLSRGRPLFDPDRPPIQYADIEEFARVLADETTIGFLRRTAPAIRDRARTAPGRHLANRRYFELIIALQMLEGQLRGTTV